jgi:DNA-directed RNA polymerase specialized sigma24 family protein
MRELVERFRRGDEHAATELHDRFVRGMIAKVRYMLLQADNRGAIDSEGIVQEAFRSFFSAVLKPAFDPDKGKVGGYLAAIVANKVRARLRRRQPRGVDPEGLSAITDAAVAFAAGNLTEPEVEATLSETVADLFEDATPKEIEVLKLFLDVDDERSRAELAKATRRSLTSVGDVIDRFTERLRERAAAAGLGDSEAG